MMQLQLLFNENFNLSDISWKVDRQEKTQHGDDRHVIHGYLPSYSRFHDERTCGTITGKPHPPFVCVFYEDGNIKVMNRCALPIPISISDPNYEEKILRELVTILRSEIRSVENRFKDILEKIHECKRVISRVRTHYTVMGNTNTDKGKENEPRGNP